MPFPSFHPPSMGMTLDDTKSYLVGLIRELNYFLSVLDHLNITRLDAKVVVANTITADKMNVNELSAISANLGHITAGLIEAVTIIGSLIKTANTGSRVELSNTDNLIRIINSNGSEIKGKPDVSGNPVWEFTNGTDTASILVSPGNLTIQTTGSPSGIGIASGRQITISPGGGYKVIIPSWDSFFSSAGPGRTLQQELNDIWDAIIALSGP